MSKPDLSPAQQAALAKQRHFAISIMRFAGVALVMFGIAMMVGRVPGVEGDMARYAGFAIAVVGLIDFAVVPRLMARRWASPRDPE